MGYVSGYTYPSFRNATSVTTSDQLAAAEDLEKLTKAFMPFVEDPEYIKALPILDLDDLTWTFLDLERRAGNLKVDPGTTKSAVRPAPPSIQRQSTVNPYYRPATSATPISDMTSLLNVLMPFVEFGETWIKYAEAHGVDTSSSTVYITCLDRAIKIGDFANAISVVRRILKREKPDGEEWN